MWKSPIRASSAMMQKSHEIEQLEAAGDGVALDHGDRRLADVEGASERAGRDLGDLDGVVRGAQELAVEHVEVGAGAEGVAAPRISDDPNLLVVLGAVERLPQRHEQLPVDAVLLLGAVEPDRGDTAVDLVLEDVVVVCPFVCVSTVILSSSLRCLSKTEFRSYTSERASQVVRPAVIRPLRPRARCGCVAMMPYLKSIQYDLDRSDPRPAPAHRLRQHLAAARRPADARGHRPARGRGAVGPRVGLAQEGVRIEDLELVLVTHHHLDHSVSRRPSPIAPAHVAALDRGADYGATTRSGRRPIAVLARAHAPSPRAGERARRDGRGSGSTSERAPSPIAPTCACRTAITSGAGGRDLTVIARPGHSTTDTLFVDEDDGLAFVGDHLLAGISSNTEIYPAAEPTGTRPRARVDTSRACARLPRCRCGAC